MGKGQRQALRDEVKIGTNTAGTVGDGDRLLSLCSSLQHINDTQHSVLVAC